MCELRSLELSDDLTTEGLTTILDQCPVLESLYITSYFDSEMAKGKMCETEEPNPSRWLG